jgi:hypothetical protein
MSKPSLRSVLMALLLLSAAANAYAWPQRLSGDIEGVVKDATGALIPSVSITVTNVETSAERTLISDEYGHFLAALLPIGEYSVRAQLQGFGTWTGRFVAKTGERTNINIILQVGNVSEEVTVQTTAAQLVNANDAQIAMSIDEKRVKELPLATRDPLVLATLSPGVVPVTAANPFLGTGSFNSNGGRGRGNNITIDGVVSTDVSTTGGAGFGTLDLDAIQEFKLITNNFNAEFGRNANSQVQIITKGGTNTFHGTAYEFLQNDKLNARDYFDTTGKASVIRRNQFGATAGGPIVKDKLFYFGTYQGLQIRGVGGTQSRVVPTAAQLATVTDPTSRAILDLYKLPPAQTESGGVGRVSQSAPRVTKENGFSTRLDYSMGGGRDLITGRYAFQDSSESRQSLTFIGTSLAGFGADSVNRPHSFGLGWTHVLSNRVVNEARFAFGRSAPNFTPQFTEYGPRINITGFALFGESDIIPQGRVQNTFQYSDTLTWTNGRHNWKFGGDVHRIQANSIFDSNVRGTWRFNSWDDFAVGLPASYDQRFGSTVRGNRLYNVFGFVQDDFKVRPDFTLNLGVRLEVAGGVSEVNDILSNLDFTKPAPIGGAPAGPLGSFVLGGQAFETNYNWQPRFGFSWNPNRGKWVVRGGYGIANDFIFLNPITNLRFTPPFVQTLTLTSFTAGNSYANIYAGTAPAQASSSAAVGQFSPTQTNFGAFSPIEQTLKNPQVQQFSLTIERELSNTLALRTSYIGTISHYLLRSRHANMIPQGTIAPALNEADEIARIPQFTTVFSAANATATGSSNRIDPRFNAITLIEGSGSANYHGLAVELNKRFSRGNQFQVSYTFSKSIDDASDVLNVVVNDFPVQQNPFDLRNSRAVSQFDIPHRLVINHVWQPQWAAGLTGVTGKLLHGWGFSGIFQAQSGFPTNVFTGPRYGINETSLTGNSTNAIRPTVVGDLSKLKFAPLGSPEAALIPTPAQRGVNTTSGARNTNTSNFPLVQTMLGNFGNLGRNALRLNGLTNFDWVFLKDTAVTEAMKVQFRAELFNVFNNTSFASFDNNLSQATFGTYQGTDTTPRQIQLALKLIW